MKTKHWYLALVVLCASCANDDECIDSLEELCKQRTCPSSPRAAESDPETYPQVYHDGDKFVIGLNSGLGASEFHFVGAKLLGYLAFDDAIREGDECPTLLTLGELNIEFGDDNRGLTELNRNGSAPYGTEEIEACSHLCTFNQDWEGELDRCSADLFDDL